MTTDNAATTADRIAELERECDRLKAAVVEFLSASGHDLCQENRAKLAHAAGLPSPGYPTLVPQQEFALGCIRYRQELYGPDGPGSETEVWEAERDRLRDQLAAALAEVDRLRREIDERED